MDLVLITNELIERVSIDNIGHIKLENRVYQNLKVNGGDETISRN